MISKQERGELPPPMAQKSHSAFQFDQYLMIAMVVHVTGAVSITGFSKIDLPCIQRHLFDSAVAHDLQRCPLDGIEQVITLVLV